MQTGPTQGHRKKSGFNPGVDGALRDQKSNVVLDLFQKQMTWVEI